MASTLVIWKIFPLTWRYSGMVNQIFLFYFSFSCSWISQKDLLYIDFYLQFWCLINNFSSDDFHRWVRQAFLDIRKNSRRKFSSFKEKTQNSSLRTTKSALFLNSLTFLCGKKSHKFHGKNLKRCVKTQEKIWKLKAKAQNVGTCRAPGCWKSLQKKPGVRSNILWRDLLGGRGGQSFLHGGCPPQPKSFSCCGIWYIWTVPGECWF